MNLRKIVLCLLVFVFSMITVGEALPESYGRIRALKERAITVTRQKNNFVTKVLDSYHIPYTLSKEGVVVRIKIDTAWSDVNRIDIVPLVNDDKTGVRVIAHNIYFDTDQGMFHLVSQLIIR